MSEWVEYFKKTNRSVFEQCLNCRRLIELIIDNTPKRGKVLEIGCGTALLSFILADYGYGVTASDVSGEVLDFARERVGLRCSRLRFVEADMLDLGNAFKDEHFDTVCHKGVMEHFTDEDIIKGLAEQKKISRRVIFHIPNDRSRLKNECFGDERLLSNRRWVTLIKKAGFRHIGVFGDYDVKRPFFLLPGLFFRLKFSFWWKYSSNHTIFVCG